MNQGTAESCCQQVLLKMGPKARHVSARRVSRVNCASWLIFGAVSSPLAKSVRCSHMWARVAFIHRAFEKLVIAVQRQVAFATRACFQVPGAEPSNANQK